jgi:hypothetical protein
VGIREARKSGHKREQKEGGYKETRKKGGGDRKDQGKRRGVVREVRKKVG